MAHEHLRRARVRLGGSAFWQSAGLAPSHDWAQALWLAPPMWDVGAATRKPWLPLLLGK